MSLVIVTKKCYLVANQIHYITMDLAGRDEYGNVLDKKSKNWKIVINYTPEDSPAQQMGNSRRDDRQTVQILIDDLEVAHNLHKEIVYQIRKQLPDKLFLDQVIDQFLGGGPLDEPDERPTTIRKSRTKKRRSKKVLRRVKLSR